MEKKPADTKALDAAIAELPGSDWQPMVTARASARMGQRYAAAGNQAQAESSLKSAQTALASLPKLKPMPLPGMKDLYEAKFPSMQPEETAAAAAFEVARLQATLNQTDAAWQSIQQGLDTLRSLGSVADRRREAPTRSQNLRRLRAERFAKRIVDQFRR